MADADRRDDDTHAEGQPAPSDTAWSELVQQLSAHSPKASRYKLEGEIARGGMGAIVKVWDKDLRRHLAMKVVLGKTLPGEQGSTPAVDDHTLGRFLEEAQVTGQLDHPGVVPVHELGIDDEGLVYFTMRLVKGRDLKAIFGLVRDEKEGWNQTRALGVLLKACEALAYAHSKGVIHRDLKPANIMVGRFGEVYVMDWGLARVVGRPDRKDIRLQAEGATSIGSLKTVRRDAAEETPDSPLVTMDGDVVGTPAYMAPEQARGDVDRVDVRSDVYSMGAILYELLTGQMPYVPAGEKRTQRTILAAVLAGPPEAVHDVARGVPLELEAICEKAMARDAATRYRDVLELADDLRAYLEGRVVKAHRTGAVIELRKWVVRNKPLAVALAAGVLLLVLGVGISTAFAHLADQRRIEADKLRDVAQEQERQARQQANVMSAIQRLHDLVESADALWPATPKTLPRYESWLEEAQLLIDGAAKNPVYSIAEYPGVVGYEATLASMRSRAKVHTPKDGEPGEGRQYSFDNAQDQWWHDQITHLVTDLKGLPEEKLGLMSSGGSAQHGWGMRRRIECARTTEARSVSGESARHRWTEAIEAIGRSPKYNHLALSPQLGLLPIGEDSGSGLWEFWYVMSGDEPLRGSDGALVLTESTGIVLVLIPGGTFWMGAQPYESSGRNYDPLATRLEGPVHEVTLSAFFLSKYEMTQAQWSRFTLGNPSRYDAEQYDSYWNRADEPWTALHPVEQVSWDECLQTLTRMGLTLPSEAQWEFGCRAGTSTPWWPGTEVESLQGAANLLDQFRMSHGDVPRRPARSDHVRLSSDSFQKTGDGWVVKTRSKIRFDTLQSEEAEPSQESSLDDGQAVHAQIGSYRPNSFGLHDMHGNVCEWCLDAWDGGYGKEPVRDPVGSLASDHRSVRGGSYSVAIAWSRSAARHYYSPGFRDDFVGCRPARGIDP